MTPSTLWQRRPVAFAGALAALTVLGLVLMLGEGGALAYAGFAAAALPGLLAVAGYVRARR